MKKQNGVSSILVLLLVLSVVGCSVFFFFNLKNIESIESVSSKENVYLIKITNLGEGEFDTIDVNELLGFRSLFQDGSFKRNKKTNYLYYLTEKTFDEDEVIESELYKAEIISNKSGLLPYLKDTKYCEIDADCVREESFCDIGSYNQYYVYYVWGCAVIQNIEGYTTDDINALGCPLAASGFPNIDIKSIEHKCVDNKCAAVSVKLKCLD